MGHRPPYSHRRELILTHGRKFFEALLDVNTIDPDQAETHHKAIKKLLQYMYATDDPIGITQEEVRVLHEHAASLRREFQTNVASSSSTTRT